MKRGSSIHRAWLLGAPALLTGCIQILGFEEIDENGPCAVDTDCAPSQVCGGAKSCEPACSDNSGCGSGYQCSQGVDGRGKCVPEMDASEDRIAADVRVDSAAEGGEDAVADSGSANVAASDANGQAGNDAALEGAVDDGAGGNCSPACQAYSWCASSSCLSFQRWGYWGPGSVQQGAQNDVLQAIQLPLRVCGYLTGVGFNAQGADAVTAFRLAVYADDGGGNPGALIAETAPQTGGGGIQVGANEVPIVADGQTPPVIGCSDAIDYVWVAAIWNRNGIEFTAEPSQANWVWVREDSTAVIANGFPRTFPKPANRYSPPLEMPHVYVMVTNEL